MRSDATVQPPPQIEREHRDPLPLCATRAPSLRSLRIDSETPVQNQLPKEAEDTKEVEEDPNSAERLPQDQNRRNNAPKRVRRALRKRKAKQQREIDKTRQMGREAEDERIKRLRGYWDDLEREMGIARGNAGDCQGDKVMRTIEKDDGEVVDKGAGANGMAILEDD